jgi:HSP20 family molecular chaperone IbpA
MCDAPPELGAAQEENREETMTMIEIEETVQKLEGLYQALTGHPVPTSDGPYAPIPPEKNADQHVGEQLDRLIGILASTPVLRAEPPVPASPPVSVFESDHEILIRVDLPGVPRGSARVTYSGNVLTVEGSRPAPESNGNGYRLRRREGVFSRFQRQLLMPPGLAPEELSAQMKDGVLEIHVPRALPPPAVAHSIPVE